jgi:hypothetical protein
MATTKVWNGSSWQQCFFKNPKVWNGSDWVYVDTKFWNGSNWQLDNTLEYHTLTVGEYSIVSTYYTSYYFGFDTQTWNIGSFSPSTSNTLYPPSSPWVSCYWENVFTVNSLILAVNTASTNGLRFTSLNINGPSGLSTYTSASAAITSTGSVLTWRWDAVGNPFGTTGTVVPVYFL